MTAASEFGAGRRGRRGRSRRLGGARGLHIDDDAGLVLAALGIDDLVGGGVEARQGVDGGRDEDDCLSGRRTGSR